VALLTTLTSNFYKGNIMPDLNKLSKVNESLTIYRYDNGWMLETGGRNEDNDWASCKVICNTEDELIDLIREYNNKPLDQ
jgi:hypothetical protein